MAAAAIPPSYVPRIVLLSDGNQTAGDALQAALRGGVPVSTVPLPARTRARGAGLGGQRARPGPRGRAVLRRGRHRLQPRRRGRDRGLSRAAQGRRREGEGQEGREPLPLPPADRPASGWPSTPPASRASRTRCSTTTPTSAWSSPAASRACCCRERPEAGQAPGRRPWSRKASRSTSGRRRACRTRWPTCRTTNCSILSNVPATSMSTRQMEVARTYVQDLGGGLIMLGGDQSFGLGGYYKTTLEEILPVRSDFEKEKEKPSLAMVLVIDKSGSMGGAEDRDGQGRGQGGGRAARAERQGRRDRLRRRPVLGREVQSAANKGQIIDQISTHRGRRRHDDGPGDGRGLRGAPEHAGQAQARHHPDRRHLRAGRLRGHRPEHGPGQASPARPSPSATTATQAARGDRPDRQRPLLPRRRPEQHPADLRQGDGDGQQVGHQRAAVHADRHPADAGPRRHRVRRRPVPARATS